MPAQVQAAAPGFRTLGIWNETQGLRLDLCIWYPVSSAPSSVRYGDWVLKVNRRANPVPGRFPLLVLSHDSAGSRFAHHELAAALACLGYIVVAPTHSYDNAQNMSTLFSPQQMNLRLEELAHTINTVCADPELGKSIDSNRIGVIGFGSGAASALLAAGGSFSPTAWEKWKAIAPKHVPYMYAWARTRIDSMASDKALTTVRADRRIRAVALIAPAFSMLFDETSLAKIRIPLLLTAVGRDPVNPAPEYLSQLRASLPQTTRTSFIPDATPLALMSRPDGRSEHLPTRSPMPDRMRELARLQLEQDLAHFFQETIGNPQLPAPEPEAMPEPEKLTPPSALVPAAPGTHDALGTPVAPARRQKKKRVEKTQRSTVSSSGPASRPALAPSPAAQTGR